MVMLPQVEQEVMTGINRFAIEMLPLYIQKPMHHAGARFKNTELQTLCS